MHLDDGERAWQKAVTRPLTTVDWLTIQYPSQKAMLLRVVGAVLLGLASTSAFAEDIRVRLVPREMVEDRLREYSGTNSERGARLKRMFTDAGCGEQLSEQPVKHSKIPNVICVLPGTSDRVIIVGGHFDRVPTSDGVADNWSGASLLPSFYKALKGEPRRHTYVFIGFTDEEKGLVGSHFYARQMTREQVAVTDAMVNLDTLGLAPTEVWAHRSDKSLMEALVRVALYLKMPISAVNFERVGSTDSESFASRKIPRITIHSLTQKSENAMILHTPKDKLSAMNLDDYYDTYHVVAVYLAYLDQFSARTAPSR
ncbi:MAG: M28 family peptidase [Pseudomonadota bacterium]